MTIYVYHKLGIFVYTFSGTLNGLYGTNNVAKYISGNGSWSKDVHDSINTYLYKLYTDYTFKFILLEL